MGDFFKRNDFKTDYRKRPNDQYKSAVDSLDQETKKKFDRRRNLIMAIVVLAVLCLIIVLAATGIGTNKEKSLEAVFTGAAPARINCLGDSFTEGAAASPEEETLSGVTYPDALKAALEKHLGAQVEVRNYGSRESALENTSYKRMAESADIVMILYGLNNYLSGQDAEGTLEANIDGIRKLRSLVYLVTYPVCKDGPFARETRDANSYIRSVSGAKEVFLFDAAAYFDGLVENGTYAAKDLYGADRLHLSETGYRLLGEFLAEGLMAESGRN